ncbi:MAG: glycosyltransferase [Thermoproteota archaeon]
MKVLTDPTKFGDVKIRLVENADRRVGSLLEKLKYLKRLLFNQTYTTVEDCYEFDEKSSLPFVSVIIASKRERSTLLQCLSSLENQDYPKKLYEVIVASVNPYNIDKPEILIRNIVCGAANQAEARNIAVRYAKGDILAFCDDDCILPPGWLRSGVRHFKNKEVAVVGGPAKPPIEGVLFGQILAGLIHMSYLGVGSHSLAFFNHGKTKPFFCRPTHIIGANMFVDRKKFEEVGGFGQHVPQEEERLNNKLLERGYKLVYDPHHICTHFQRGFGFKFLKNIFWLAKGSGKFCKENFAALNKLYLIPPIFTLGIFISPFSIVFPFFNFPYQVIASLYIFVVVIESIRLAMKNVKRLRAKILTFSVLPVCFFLHHFTFGLGFIVGLISKRGNASMGVKRNKNALP